MKRIFVFSSRSLFSLGIELLLRQDQGVELVGDETDVDQAIERIRELSPDVVLVEQDAECDPGVIVVQVLKEMPKTKIVGIDLADNTIRVYRGEQRTPREIGDLLQVVKSGACQDESSP